MEQEKQESQEKKFREYPSATGTIKDEQGTYHRARVWAPPQKDPLREHEGLKGTLEINNPETGHREKHEVEFKPKEHNGQHYLSGVVERGKDQNPVLVRIVGVDGPHGRFAAVRMAEMHKEGDKTQFQEIKGQGGVLRMNEAMEKKFLEKGQLYETDLLQEKLGVPATAIGSKDLREQMEQAEMLHQQEQAEPQKAAREAEGQEPGQEQEAQQQEVEEEEDLGLGR